ncbi:MAG TPA: HDOD domain-containing protein [Steroidobacteraceae bacterium]|nr:HDOD domain-containing protein [Steroidobacteraceae bacterium]
MANLASSTGKLKGSVPAKTAAPARPASPAKPVAAGKPVAAAKPVAPAKAAAPAEIVAVSEEERSFALAFLASLATEVSKGTVNLPSFPDVVMRIRKALAEPNVRLSEIVKIVGTEPRLAARLLQVANSAAFNPAGKHLIDLRAAITRLGHRPVQSAVMAFAVKQVRLAPSLRSISNHLNILWELSISVAAICQVIARRTKVSPEEAFLTGLLHGIGRLYIMVRSAGTSQQLFQNPAFRDMISGWHPAIGKAVLENWEFDEAMCEAVANQGDYEHRGRSEPDLTDVLVVSLVLARVLRRPGPRTVDMDGINSFGRLHLTPQECAEVLRHAEHQLGSLHAALGC